MESEPPSPEERPCTFYFLNLWTFEMDKITLGLSYTNTVFQTTVRKANRKARVLSMRT